MKDEVPYFNLRFHTTLKVVTCGQWNKQKEIRSFLLTTDYCDIAHCFAK